MTSPLTWGAAVLIFALSWVLNSPSPASGFDTLRGIGDDIETAISTPAAKWLKVARNRSLGYPSEPVWLRWSIPDDGSELVAIHNPWVDHFQLYFVRDDTILASHTSGGKHPILSRPVEYSEFAFPIPTQPRPTHLFILDTDATSPALYPVSFLTWSELVAQAGQLHALHGIFYGIILIMLVYNAVIYTSVGDKAYLYLVLYAAGLTCLIATSDGFGQLYLWSESTQIQNLLVSLSLATVIWFLGQFCMTFLETREHLPGLSRVLRGVQWLAVLNTTILVVYDNDLNAVAEPIILLAFASLMLTIGFARALQDSPAAQIFLAANGIVCLFGSIVALTHLGWIPDSSIGRHGALVGAALELALLSFALARRLKRQERLQELLRAQTSALTEEVAQLKAASNLAEEHRQLQRSMQHQQKQRTIGQMAGGIAHDFNNILATILGFAELALEKPTDREKNVRYLEEIRTAGQRGAALVKQLITYSRGDQRAAAPVAVNTAVNDAVTLLRSSLPATVTLRTTFPERELRTVLDPTQFKQVLVNLCLNAGDAMDNRGTINLSVSEKRTEAQQCSSCLNRFSGDFACVTIDDAGGGFEGRAYELFTPFFTTKPVGRGSGLGLSVVHGIVHEHGGHIVASPRPATGGADGNEAQLPTGSRFVVFLPLETPPVATGVSQGHVLLIEDDPSMASYLQTLLEEQSYQVTSAALPTTALEKFMAAPDSFDLVITDQLMPHGTGLELAQDLLGLRPDLPIIITTGSRDLINVDRAKQTGIKAVFNKPIDSELLLSRVRSLIQGTA